MKVPRVAIIGVALESNRQAPPAGESDFASAYIMRGPDILEDARAKHPRIMREASSAGVPFASMPFHGRHWPSMKVATPQAS